MFATMQEYVKYLQGLYHGDHTKTGGILSMQVNVMTNGHMTAISRALELCDHAFIHVTDSVDPLFTTEERIHMVNLAVQQEKTWKGRVTAFYRETTLTGVKFPGMKPENKQELLACLPEIADGIYNVLCKHLHATKLVHGEFKPGSMDALYWNYMGSYFQDKPEIEILTFPRDFDDVSATQARKWLEIGNMDKVEEMVPKKVFDWLAAWREGRG